MSENTEAEAQDKSITFELTVTPSDELLAGVIITALEGGIGYWSSCSEYEWENRPPSEVYAVVHDSEDKDKEFRITIETIREGLRKIVHDEVKYNLGEDEYMQNLAVGILTEEDYDYDAGDADNIVQAGLFGELVYG